MEKLEQLIEVKGYEQTSQDGLFTLKKANWLGWCVNDSPSMMLKKVGTDYVVPILNYGNINSK